MKVDALLTKDFTALVPDALARAQDGYDALWVSEAQHEPFLQCLEVARAAPGVQVGTAIATRVATAPVRWIFFVGNWSTIFFQYLSIGGAALADDQAEPIFVIWVLTMTYALLRAINKQEGDEPGPTSTPAADRAAAPA